MTNDSLTDQYVDEINKHAMLSRAEEQALARSGRPDAAHKLVIANLRFVVKVAHEYRGYGLNLLDLIQEGNIGLTMAVKKFDPDKGYRLISYAVWWIRAYIQDFVLRSWSLVKLGTTHVQRKLFFKLRSTREKVDTNATRGETIAAIASYLSESEVEVSNMEVRLGLRDFSLDATLGHTGATHQDMLGETLGTETQEETVFAREKLELTQATLEHLTPLLSETEQYLLRHRLMADKRVPLKAIGARFGISRERTRQIQVTLIKKIKHALGGYEI